MPWHVYILQCADGSLYTGITTDLQRRLQQHNGELTGGPRFTRGRRPVQLVWSAAAADRSVAQQREAAIKNLPRERKLQLVAMVEAGGRPFFGPTGKCLTLAE